jgi:transcriptional regulator of arginine metabolism
MPSESELRDIRQRAIRDLLRRGAVRSQEELVARLGRRGIAATQSSVSRDLRELGAIKLRGRYRMPAPPAAASDLLLEAAHFVRGLRPAGPHLTVVLTTVGAAQTVGLAIDRAGWPEVAGTVAGDDTVFVASPSGADQKRFHRRLLAVLPEGAA